MVTVAIPPALRDRTGRQRLVQVEGGNVREVIEDLERNYPGIRFNICYETGELRPYVNVFVGDESVRYLDGLDTPLQPNDTVHIMHSIAGGSR